MKATIRAYAIRKKFYDSVSIDIFENRKEWEAAIDSEAASGKTRGTDGSFEVSIFEIPEDAPKSTKNWEGVVWHPAAKDRFASIDSIPEEWEEIGTQSVSYWNPREIWAEKKEDGSLSFLADEHEEKPDPEDGGEVVEAWTGGDEIYISEKEMFDSENPSLYLCI